MTAIYQTLVDLRDESGDTDLFIPKGTNLNFVSDEEDYLILEDPSSGAQFPVMLDEIFQIA